MSDPAYLSGMVVLDMSVASPSNQGSVGNVTFAKTFTIPTIRGSVKVPAFSGPALRHTYSVHLARLAAARGLPVCDLCRRGIFLKHGDVRVVEELGGRPLVRGVGKDVASKREAERRVIEGCVVEDVTGFLLTAGEGDKGVARRTSRILVSYALGLPGASHVTPEVRARQILGMEKGEDDYSAQMLFHVQRVSGLFALAFVLHLAGVGRTSDEYGDPVELEDAPERRLVALEALGELLRNPIGAHAAEALPHVSFVTGILVEGSGPLVPESPVALLAHEEVGVREAVEEALARTEEAAGRRGYVARRISSPEEIP